MFVVLEGLDGAGKSTQIRLLCTYFREQGIESEYIHFPRFDAPIYGELIARFLRGEFGKADEVDPYLVTLLFAGDRADAAPKIRQWLAEGKAVVLDRYVYSNVAFQCGKLATDEERNHLRHWILDLEFKHNNLPRPDLSLFLDVPFSFTKNKLEQAREGEDRAYLKGGHDIHEDSLALQREVRKVFLASAEEDPSLQVVDCSDREGEMATPEAIFDKIRLKIEPLIQR